MHKSEGHSTPYDDAFKTMLEKFPQLIIPIINEQFGKDYALDEKVKLLGQEIHSSKDKKGAADSVLCICEDIYHVECQSNPDSTIAIRILEYDFFIALRSPFLNDEDIYELRMPRSCVLYLRHNSRTKDNVDVKVWLDNDEYFLYTVPIIKVQTYTKEDIFRKNLFMLLPFYIMRYESEADDINQSKEMLHQLTNEYRDIIRRMEVAFNAANDTEGRRLCVELQVVMKKVSEYFFRNQEAAKTQIGGTIMGGTCWKTFEEECVERGLEQGLEQGLERGLEQGMERGLEALRELVRDGIITEEVAAAKLDMTLDEYRDAIKRLK